MAITNQERVGKALELLKEGLVSFVERELKAQHAQRSFEEARASVGDTQSSLFWYCGRAALGCGLSPFGDVEPVERRFPKEIGPGGAKTGDSY